MVGVSPPGHQNYSPEKVPPIIAAQETEVLNRVWHVAREAGLLTKNVGPMVTPVGMGTTATNSPPSSHRKFKMILFLEELLSSPTHYLWLFGSPGKEVFLSIGDEPENKQENIFIGNAFNHTISGESFFSYDRPTLAAHQNYSSSFIASNVYTMPTAH